MVAQLQPSRSPPHEINVSVLLLDEPTALHERLTEAEERSTTVVTPGPFYLTSCRGCRTPTLLLLVFVSPVTIPLTTIPNQLKWCGSKSSPLRSSDLDLPR